MVRRNFGRKKSVTSQTLTSKIVIIDMSFNGGGNMKKITDEKTKDLLQSAVDYLAKEYKIELK